MLKTFQRIGLQKSIYLSNHLTASPQLTCPLAALFANNRQSGVLKQSCCYKYSYKFQPSLNNMTNGSATTGKPKPATTAVDLASGMPPPEILEVSSRFVSKASENLFKVNFVILFILIHYYYIIIKNRTIEIELKF